MGTMSKGRGDGMKCCDKIDDDWIEGDMWHDNHTTFGFDGRTLLVTYRCPHCGHTHQKILKEVRKISWK